MSVHSADPTPRELSVSSLREHGRGAADRTVQGPIALLLTPTEAPARGTLALATALVARGRRVDLLIAAAPSWSGVDLPTCLDVIHLESDHRGATLAGLLRYLRLRRPEWILTGHEDGATLALLARRMTGVSVKLAIRGPAPTAGPPARQRAVGRLRTRMTYRSADVVVASATHVASAIAERCGLAADQVLVIDDVHDVLRGTSPATTTDQTSGRASVVLIPGPAVEPTAPSPVLEALDRLAGTTELDVVIASDDADPGRLEGVAERLRRARTVTTATGDEARVAASRAHDLLIVAAPPWHVRAPVAAALAAGANVIVVGWLDLHDHGLATSGLVRSVPGGDGLTIERNLREAIARPLVPAVDDVHRWAAQVAVDGYIDIFERRSV
jgi:hypothetical protein